LFILTMKKVNVFVTIPCLRSIGWHTYVNLGVVSLREGRHNKKINKHG
jgi:hypothetical protein